MRRARESRWNKEHRESDLRSCRDLGPSSTGCGVLLSVRVSLTSGVPTPRQGQVALILMARNTLEDDSGRVLAAKLPSTAKYLCSEPGTALVQRPAKELPRARSVRELSRSVSVVVNWRRNSGRSRPSRPKVWSHSAVGMSVEIRQIAEACLQRDGADGPLGRAWAGKHTLRVQATLIERIGTEGRSLLLDQRVK